MHDLGIKTYFNYRYSIFKLINCNSDDFIMTHFFSFPLFTLHNVECTPPLLTTQMPVGMIHVGEHRLLTRTLDMDKGGPPGNLWSPDVRTTARYNTGQNTKDVQPVLGYKLKFLTLRKSNPSRRDGMQQLNDPATATDILLNLLSPTTCLVTVNAFINNL